MTASELRQRLSRAIEPLAGNPTMVHRLVHELHQEEQGTRAKLNLAQTEMQTLGKALSMAQEEVNTAKLKATSLSDQLAASQATVGRYKAQEEAARERTEFQASAIKLQSLNLHYQADLLKACQWYQSYMGDIVDLNAEQEDEASSTCDNLTSWSRSAKEEIEEYTRANPRVAEQVGDIIVIYYLYKMSLLSTREAIANGSVPEMPPGFWRDLEILAILKYVQGPCPNQHPGFGHDIIKCWHASHAEKARDRQRVNHLSVSLLAMNVLAHYLWNGREPGPAPRLLSQLDRLADPDSNLEMLGDEPRELPG